MALVAMFNVHVWPRTTTHGHAYGVDSYRDIRCYIKLYAFVALGPRIHVLITTIIRPNCNELMYNLCIILLFSSEH